jgi:hypothetical protein
MILWENIKVKIAKGHFLSPSRGSMWPMLFEKNYINILPLDEGVKVD